MEISEKEFIELIIFFSIGCSSSILIWVFSNNSNKNYF
jgi:hypothetical protein